MVLHYEAQKSLIEEDLRNGEFKPLPVLLLGEMISSTSVGVITYVLRSPDTLEEPELMETLLETLVAGLRSTPQGSNP